MLRSGGEHAAVFFALSALPLIIRGQPAIKLGACGYFHNPAAHLYQVMDFAAKVAFDEGFFDDQLKTKNFTVEINAVNTRCSRTVASAVALPMILGTGLEEGRLHSDITSTEPVVAISGCGCSGPSSTISAMGNPFKVPLVSGAATSPTLSDKVAYPYFSRVIPQDSMQGVGLAHLIAYYGWRRIVLTYPQGSLYAEGIVEYVRDSKASRAPGVTIFREPAPYMPIATAEEALAYNYSRTFSTAADVRKVRPQPRVFVLLANARDAGPMIRAYEENGLTGPGTAWLLADSCCGLTLLSSVATLHEYTWYPAWRAAGVEGPEVFRNGTGFYDWSTRTPEAMVGMMCLQPVSKGPRFYSEEFRNFWTGLTRDKLLAAGMPEEHSSDPSFFTNITAVSAVLYYPLVFDALTTLLVAIGDLIAGGAAPADVRGQALSDAIREVQFEGLSGNIAFDSNGDRRSGYRIANLQASANGPDFVDIGSFDAASYVLALDRDAVFPGGTTEVPSDQPVPCDAGSLFTGGGCEACPAGKYGPAVDSQCFDCTEGTFAAVAGMTECTPCDKGYAQNRSGQTACVICRPGFAAEAKLGQKDCRKCDLGTFTWKEGSLECDRCLVGTYQDVLGSSSCETCPAPTTTLFQGASDSSDCVCPAGTYGQLATAACEPCPQGMACDNPNSTEAAIHAIGSEDQKPYPKSQRGYMTRASEPLLPYRCKVSDWCPGGSPGACARNRDPSAVGCADCVKGTYTGSDGACHECARGEGPALMSLGILMSILASGFFVAVVSREVWLQPSSTMTCIIVAGLCFTSVQTMLAFGNLSVEWAPSLLSVLDALSLLSFDLKVLRVECMVGSAVLLQYACRQLVAPLGALCILFALAAKKHFIDPSLEYEVEAVNAIGSVFQIFFISILIAAIVPFACYAHPGSAGFSMTSTPSILCWEDDDHTAMMVVGIICCTLIILPYLALVAYITLKYPKFMSNSSSADAFLRMFRFLFFRYMPSTYYYGGVALLRATSVCLVPIIFTSEAALQIIMMSAILSFFVYVQLVLHPWRSRLANLVDGGCTLLLGLLLVCVAISTSFEDTSALVGGLGLAFLILLFLAAVAVVAFSIYRRFSPSTLYHNFVCHHKADAAAQARFLQLLLEQRTGQECFIDSDDLTNVDELLDIVKCRVRRLVVYLTADTLRRPWCAGEITITANTHRSLVAVRTPSFRPPSDEDLADIEQYVDLSSAKLVQYGITSGFISDAFKWLLRMDMVEFGEASIGCARFHGIVDSIVRASASMSRTGSSGSFKSSAGIRRDDTVVVSSDPEDNEAMAATGILVTRIQECIFASVGAGICVLADQAAWSKQEETDVVRSARAVIVILTPGSLRSTRQLQVIVDGIGSSDTLPMIPVSTPYFRFPSEQYYAEYLSVHFPTSTADEVWLRVQKLFKKIAVLFATSASLQVIDAQAADLLGRIPPTGKSRRGFSREECFDLSMQDGADAPCKPPEPPSDLRGTSVASGASEPPPDPPAAPAPMLPSPASLPGLVAS